MLSIKLEVMSSDLDFLEYEEQALIEMSDEDVVSAAELKAVVSVGAGESWRVFIADEEKPVAWLSLIAPSPFSADSSSVHILSVFVCAAAKGKGVGRSTIQWVIDNNPDKLLTALIQPENEPSIRLFESLSFIRDFSGDYECWGKWQRHN